MVASVGEENVFDLMQYPFIIKTLSKLGKKENFLNTIQDVTGRIVSSKKMC